MLVACRSSSIYSNWHKFHAFKGQSKPSFFCWLVNGSKSPNPKDCVGTLHFAHSEHALHAVEKYNRGILEVSHLSSKSIVGYGGYGSSIRNLW